MQTQAQLSKALWEPARESVVWVGKAASEVPLADSPISSVDSPWEFSFKQTSEVR